MRTREGDGPLEGLGYNLSVPGIRNLRDNLAFVLVAVAEVILIGAVLWGIFAFEQATTQRAESRDTLGAIDAALIALVDAETGERGFVISGNEQFLAPYTDARSRLALVLTDLQANVESDATQSANLAVLLPLINRRLDTMETAIEARRHESEEAGEAEVAFGEGQQLMDEIRAALADMRRIESGTLDDRIDSSDQIGRFIGISSVTLAVATLAIVGWLFFVLQRRHETAELRRVAAAKDEFVGFVSHELRTPIAVIAGNTRLLRVRSNGERADEAVEEIGLSVERLQDIVETLLSLANAEAGAEIEVEPILLQRVARRAAALHRRRHPASDVALDVPEALPPVLGNRRAVEQVILNLLSNADKYGASGGPIEISADRSGDYVLVSVANEGPQLNPDDFEHVFEPFFRSPANAASAPGIGLGLTVCHRLVSAQGGRMGAVARPEGGASFRFSLLAVDMNGA